MTISNNDISSAANGQAISLRFAGARVFGNTIHDTPYAIGFFPQDPANAGVSRIYYNRLWNITGWAFYYSGAALNGQPAGIDVVWDSNTTALQNRAEAVNVSEITAAHVELANNVFTGSIGSAYRGCGTCSEHNNDWFGAATNVPSGRRGQPPRPAPVGCTGARSGELLAGRRQGDGGDEQPLLQRGLRRRAHALLPGEPGPGRSRIPDELAAASAASAAACLRPPPDTTAPSVPAPARVRKRHADGGHAHLVGVERRPGRHRLHGVDRERRTEPRRARRRSPPRD